MRVTSKYKEIQYELSGPINLLTSFGCHPNYFLMFCTSHQNLLIHLLSPLFHIYVCVCVRIQREYIDYMVLCILYLFTCRTTGICEVSMVFQKHFGPIFGLFSISLFLLCATVMFRNVMWIFHLFSFKLRAIFLNGT